MLPRTLQIDHIDHDEHIPPESSSLFLQGLREDSNLELDWLWLATQLASQHEQRYCLLRALAINPHSELARRGLSLLPAFESSAVATGSPIPTC